jgi:hypothetical protein
VGAAVVGAAVVGAAVVGAAVVGAAVVGAAVVGAAVVGAAVVASPPPHPVIIKTQINRNVPKAISFFTVCLPTYSILIHTTRFVCRLLHEFLPSFPPLLPLVVEQKHCFKQLQVPDTRYNKKEGKYVVRGDMPSRVFAGNIPPLTRILSYYFLALSHPFSGV